MKFAHELTDVIKKIIEFAKNLDGFRTMIQDCQIVMLKKSTFQLALIAMSRNYNIENQTLNLNSHLLPVMQLLESCEDIEDRAFAQECINCMHALASYRLSISELAILSSFVLVGSTEDVHLIKIETDTKQNVRLHVRQFLDRLTHCLSSLLSKRNLSSRSNSGKF